jgi:hypothetical protein
MKRDPRYEENNTALFDFKIRIRYALSYEMNMEKPLSHRACGRRPVPAPSKREPGENVFNL